MQRIDAIIAIARNLGDLILDSTVASAYGSAMRFNELIHPYSRQLQGKYLYLYSGAGAGQSRVIGSLDTTNRVILFPQVFDSTPSVNSKAIITDYWDKDQYDNALDRMIGKSKLKFLEDMVATISLVGTQYEYPIPSGMEWVSTLRLVPSNSSDYGSVDRVDRIFELPPRFWRIEMNPNGSYIISFDSRKVDLDNFDDYWIRVQGQAKPDISATDNAILPSQLEEYIIAGSDMLLTSQRMNENQEWQRKFYMFRDDVRALEDYVFSYGRGKRVT